MKKFKKADIINFFNDELGMINSSVAWLSFGNRSIEYNFEVDDFKSIEISDIIILIDFYMSNNIDFFKNDFVVNKYDDYVSAYTIVIKY